MDLGNIKTKIIEESIIVRSDMGEFHCASGDRIQLMIRSDLAELIIRDALLSVLQKMMILKKESEENTYDIVKNYIEDMININVK